jgi:MFS family permease
VHTVNPTPARFALARLISGHICLHACMAGTRLAAPLLALNQGYSPLAVGFLLALFALTQVFLALPAGRYADRHGLKRPVRYAVMASSFGAGLAMAFPIFPVLCVSALLTGGATGALPLRYSVMWVMQRVTPPSLSKCSVGWPSALRCPIFWGLF